jgi:hypothetical protein
LTPSRDIDACALRELGGWSPKLGGGKSGATGESGAAFPTRKLCLVIPNSTVMRHMVDWGFVDRLGLECLFCSARDDATWYLAELDEEAKRPVKGFAKKSV